ncbi:phosphoribosylanthranilate isomerase [Pontibaca methylaminivorans]|uniref:N-(5'-phosphoribosyl)anthranilate isomerase n=1 Tax=Pontibaca methylaminivorans TaxID=515897 RepID=A0A1R3WHY0_9RHOB|nr:phosphoribosylanthranilate isomerase [Pontibaca methylaminivorans]SIT77700.1 phosphoribosylanthranilate isomerase [Pontibaca methylaminivorans]
MVEVKICGLRRIEDVEAATAAGAAYVGFVFFPRSPRNVTLAEGAALAGATPEGITRVGLVVDADDESLARLVESVPLDMLQLHGQESPGRVAAIRARFGLPVMKAVGIATADDLAGLDAYLAVADRILVDAKPLPGAALPGGNGLAFDWDLIAGREWGLPWMLAGGLDPANVASALQLTGARMVDVSSGVESSPGVKDPARIHAFVRAAHDAGNAQAGFTPDRDRL